MNIEKIRLYLEKNKGKNLKFKFNGTRNQIEEFYGTIEQIYNYIFTIRLTENNNIIKSFSYADVLTNGLEIFIK